MIALHNNYQGLDRITAHYSAAVALEFEDVRSIYSRNLKKQIESLSDGFRGCLAELQAKKVQLDSLVGAQRASGVEVLELCCFDLHTTLCEIKRIEERTDEVIS